MVASKWARERLQIAREHGFRAGAAATQRVERMLDEAIAKGAEDVRLIAVAHLRAIGEAATALGHAAIPGMVDRAIAEVRAEADKLMATSVKGEYPGDSLKRVQEFRYRVDTFDREAAWRPCMDRAWSSKGDALNAIDSLVHAHPRVGGTFRVFDLVQQCEVARRTLR